MRLPLLGLVGRVRDDAGEATVFGFCRAGAIWFSLRPPRPTSAIPTFFRDFLAWARVTLVLINGAAATAAACPRNFRRVSMLASPAMTRNLT